MRAPVCGAALAALALVLSCQNPAYPAGASSPGGPVRTAALWEPLDTHDSGLWQKAAWTNGGMFNAGFLADHATIGGGALTLKLDNVPSAGKPYSSGEFRSLNTFGYGTFEAEMIAAKAPGTVSSFFLYTGSPWDEIDVEILGKNTYQVQFNYFAGGVGGHEKVIDLGFDASAAYHRYTIEYGPGFIRWSVDGVRKWGVTGSDLPTHPMQIMVNLWPGTGVDGWLGPFRYSQPLYAKYDSLRFTPR